MKIGIDLFFLRAKQGAGLKTYAYGLLNGLQSLQEEIDLVVFANRELERELRELGFFQQIITPSIRLSGTLGRIIGEQFLLPVLASRQNLDVLHSLAYWGPVIYNGVNVITVPDANAVRIPQSVNMHTRFLWQTLVRRSLRNAHRVITISHFSKQEIASLFPVDEEKIIVTHIAPKHSLTSTTAVDVDQILKSYDVLSGYLLSVASSHPHKNTRNLLIAYSKVVERQPKVPDLVLIGQPRRSHNQLIELAANLGLTGKVHFIGYISDEHLLAFYHGAAAFIFPSLYEGFGLPVLEAMSFGVPTVVSKAASIPEVAGTASLIVDAENYEQLAEAMIRVINDPNLRLRLIEKGYENIKRFSWENTARTTFSVYCEAIAL